MHTMRRRKIPLHYSKKQSHLGDKVVKLSMRSRVSIFYDYFVTLDFWSMEGLLRKLCQHFEIVDIRPAKGSTMIPFMRMY